MKKSIIVVFTLLLSLSIISSVTLAQNDEGNNPNPGNSDRVIDTAKEQKEDVQDKQSEKIEFRCNTSSSKMDALENRYRKNFDKHQETYKNIVGRLNEVIDDLEEKGYEVTPARAEVLAFHAQIEATQNDYDSFANEFQQARDLLCEDDVSGYRDSLKESRNQLRVLRGNMLKLRSEYQNSVKPELIGLREQIRDRVDSDINSFEPVIQTDE